MLAGSSLAVGIEEPAPAAADESASEASDAAGTVSWSGSSGAFGGFSALESSSSDSAEEEEGDGDGGDGAAPAPRAVMLPMKSTHRVPQTKKSSKSSKAKAQTAVAPDDDDWAALDDALAENTKHLPFGGDVPKHLQGLAGFNLETLHSERRGAPLTRHEKQRAAALKATLKAAVAKSRDARSKNDGGKTKKSAKRKKKKR